jgi:capsular polysaccharide biosynthesis protein
VTSVRQRLQAVANRVTRREATPPPTPTATRGEADAALLSAVAGRLDGVAAPAIAVLVGRPESRLAPALRALRHDALVHVLPLEEVHLALAARGPFDLIIDESVPAGMRARVLVQEFLHLRAGGVFVVSRFRRGTGGSSDVELPVARLVRKVVAGQRVGRLGNGLKLGPSEGQALAAAFAEVVFDGKHLFITNATDAMPKIREEEVDALLRLRSRSGGRVLHRIPPTQLRSRCVARHNFPDDRALRETFEVPELALRAYDDVVCTPFQGVFQDHVILPDTYRHNQRKRLANDDATQEVTKLFAAPRMDLSQAVDLPGTYFHLDNEHRGHFGHVMTEEISRLWALDIALEQHPDLQILIGTNYNRPDLMGYERSILDAFRPSVPVTLITGPARVERLVSATPMLSHPEYVHPDIAALWRRVGRALEQQSTATDLPTRVFCSRRISKRACLNTAEVEALFREHGFTVVFPEELPFADQAAMFRRAEAVAGFAGSAMFNTCLVERPISVLTLTSDRYTATNEYMIASVLGHRLTMVSSPAVPPAPGEEVDPFALPFVVDLDAEGTLLADALRRLG